MSGDIQSFPSGLLSLLGIQSGDGRGPSFLPEQLIPVMELIPYYVAGKRETVASSGVALNTVGSGASVIVPATEWWLLESISSSLVAGAAAQLMDQCIGYQLVSGGALNVLAASIPKTSAAINEQSRVGVLLANRVLLPPGGAIVLQLTSNVAAGTVTGTVSGVITRLRA